MTWYKLLDGNGGACNGGSGQWSLPTENADGTWTPGEWMPEVANPVLCVCGYHAVDAAHLLGCRGAALYELEIAPDAKRTEIREGKIAVASARLLRRIAGWTEHNLRLLACDYAEHVLPIYERCYPADRRVRECIETVRRCPDDPAVWAARAAAGAAETAWQLARLREVIGL